MPQEIETHREAVVEAVNAAFAVGRLQGIAEERARLRALIDADFLTVSVHARRPARVSSASNSYGNVITTVRSALRDIGGPIDVRGLAELIGENVTEKQTRNALRQMARTGEAVRADRGKFLWRGVRNSPAAENPDDESPGRFNLAAE